MPKARKSITDQDITQASVTLVAILMAEILRLHLASHHLLTTGMKAMMAQRLCEAIHAPNSPAQQHSVDCASQPRQDAMPMLHQQSDDPAPSQQHGTRQQQQVTQQQDTQQQDSN